MYAHVHHVAMLPCCLVPSPAVLGKVHQVGPKHQSLGHGLRVFRRRCVVWCVIPLWIPLNSEWGLWEFWWWWFTVMNGGELWWMMMHDDEWWTMNDIKLFHQFHPLSPLCLHLDISYLHFDPLCIKAETEITAVLSKGSGTREKSSGCILACKVESWSCYTRSGARSKNWQCESGSWWFQIERWLSFGTWVQQET